MSTANKQFCILFYKYHPLTDDPVLLEPYRHATKRLCASLQLTGRVLIGLSNDSEGINGTLAGSKEDLDAYVFCMLGYDVSHYAGVDQRRMEYILEFRNASKLFFDQLNLPQLFLNSSNDFKWSSWCPPTSSTNDSGSSSKEGENWFPDLHIKIVKEIVSSGGAFAGISTKDTSVGYLTPREFHHEIQALIEKHKKKQSMEGIVNNSNDDGNSDIETILIDVRNHKECQIGAFAPGISIDPQTTTFAQFPKWVKENSAQSETTSLSNESLSGGAPPSLLENKRILMYCTGGIRCEKASAYIRQVVPSNKGVMHLKGGIHKYLEEFGHDSLPSGVGVYEAAETKEEDGDGQCLFSGKNFVFDRRGALNGKDHGIDNKMNSNDTSSPQSSSDIIGKCQYCNCPYDIFHPACVCTVCREPILICDNCQRDVEQKQSALRGLVPLIPTNDEDSKHATVCRAEFHCMMHSHLSSCYFTNIHDFSAVECKKHIEQLHSHHEELLSTGRKGKHKRRTLRRQIEKIEASITDEVNTIDGSDHAMRCRHCGSTSCTFDCWGFHGGNTRMLNKSRESLDGDGDDATIRKKRIRTRVPSNHRPGRRLKREHDLYEIDVLQLSSSPSQHRDDSTGLRVPPPVIRTLRSGTKGRWCGKSVRWVLLNEFGESIKGLAQEQDVERLIAAGLVRVNGEPVKTSDVILQNMDTLELIVHWHEPPIAVPPTISLTKQTLPEKLFSSNSSDSVMPLLYCINKPSSVPIYPSGPYYANSLLLMVEAQEGLSPKTLIPLHRIDRATSGLLLCANTSSVARVIQGIMTSNASSSAGDLMSPPVMKLYLARVIGKFPESSAESPTIPHELDNIASIEWSGTDSNIIEVNAPIAVQLEPTTNNLGGDSNDDTNPMMHRTVRSDGKHSISRFKLIAYDEATNRSLIACTPITGRGHQLRVHLQLIGFPIHNDVEYGGTANVKEMKHQEELSVQSIAQQIAATTTCLHEEGITPDDVKAATKLCQCCSGGFEGIRSSFNAAQLLACGHAIDLHAYKYRLSIKERERENSSHEPDKITIIELSVDLPPWASTFADLKPADIPWLT